MIDRRFAREPDYYGNDMGTKPGHPSNDPPPLVMPDYSSDRSGGRGPLALRLAAATVVGLLVAFLSLLAVWGDMRKVKTLRMEQWETRQRLKWIAIGIESYQRREDALPKSLNHIENSGLGTEVKSNRWLVDGWDRPFIYTVNGTSWTVLSYGRDGRPGGKGADADLTNWKPEPEESKVFPAFYEFVFQLKPTRTATTGTIVCGVLAALVSFFTVHIPKFTRRGLLSVAFRVLATIVGATIIAFMIGGLEVPHH
jgi:general secretion pathway protein G